MGHHCCHTGTAIALAAITALRGIYDRPPFTARKAAFLIGRLLHTRYSLRGEAAITSEYPRFEIRSMEAAPHVRTVESKGVLANPSFQCRVRSEFSDRVCRA